LLYEEAVKSAFSICSNFFRPADLRRESEDFGLRSITRTDVLNEDRYCSDSDKDHASRTNAGHAIRLRAFELYAHRGMAEGHAVQDWLEAEAELLYSH
jgi:hypothetical protein